MARVIYLDHASTTPTDPEVVERHVAVVSPSSIGNPSTVYRPPV